MRWHSVIVGLMEVGSPHIGPVSFDLTLVTGKGIDESLPFTW